MGDRPELSKRERRLLRERDRLEADAKAIAAANSERIAAYNASIDSGEYEAPEPSDVPVVDRRPLSARLRAVKRDLGHPLYR